MKSGIIPDTAIEKVRALLEDITEGAYSEASAELRAEAAVRLRADTVTDVLVGSVKPDPNQPRKAFDEKALQALADNIRERGILQPILVRIVGGANGHVARGLRGGIGDEIGGAGASVGAQGAGGDGGNLGRGSRVERADDQAALTVRFSPGRRHCPCRPRSAYGRR